MEDRDHFINKKNGEIMFLVIFLFLIFVFYPLLHTGYTTNDDTRVSIIALSSTNLFDTSYNFSKETGRLSLLLGYYLSFVPYLFDNYLYYKFVSIGSLVINFVLFLFTVKKFVKSKNFLFFISIFYLITLQNSWEHSLVTSYPFVFQFSMDLLFISIIFFKKYVETRNITFQILSVILFIVPTLTYEMFFPYLIIFVFLSFFYEKEFLVSIENKTIKLLYMVRLFAYTLVPLLIFELIFRHFHPSDYSGTQIGIFSIKAIFQVLYQFSISSFPTYIFFHYGHFINTYTESFQGHSYNPLYLLKNARVEWIIKSILGVFFTYKVLSEKEVLFNLKKFFSIIVTSITLVILPSILPSLTPKYQSWVQSGTIAYTVTYFSFFGTVLLLSTIILYLNQLFSKYKLTSKLFIVIICLNLGIISLLTDYSNYYVAKSQTLSEYKWKTFDQFLNSKDFKDIPDNSIIYAPSLWKSISILENHDSYWSDYVKVKTGKNITVLKDKDEFTKRIDVNNVDKHNVYFLMYSQETKDFNQFITFSKIMSIELFDSSMFIYSNKAVLYSYSKNKKLNIFVNLKEDRGYKDILIDNKMIGNTDRSYFSYVVDKENEKEPFVRTEIAANGLNLDTFSVSYYTDYMPSLVGVNAIFKEGFSNIEGDFDNNWRWCGPEGLLVLENTTAVDKKVSISMGIVTGYEESANMRITGASFDEKLQVSSKEYKFNKSLIIPAKSKLNIIFSSDAKRVIAQNDPRYLVFRLNNFNISVNK